MLTGKLFGKVGEEVSLRGEIKALRGQLLSGEPIREAARIEMGNRIRESIEALRAAGLDVTMRSFGITPSDVRRMGIGGHHDTSNAHLVRTFEV